MNSENPHFPRISKTVRSRWPTWPPIIGFCWRTYRCPVCPEYRVEDHLANTWAEEIFGCKDLDLRVLRTADPANTGDAKDSKSHCCLQMVRAGVLSALQDISLETFSQ